MEGRFWKPQTSVNGSGAPERGVDDVILINKRHKHLAISQQRQLLPIARCKNQILYLLEKYETLVLIGETGSGKSTQLPQYLYEAGWTANGCGIVCTQPRRVAAITVATRVAEEFGCALGAEVGYGVRFDFKCSNSTMIRYITDGVLLRETMTDPLLRKYNVIIVDEVHQRTLHSDILLGLLKRIKKKRKDLRLVVCSATMNASDMKDFLESNETRDPNLDTAFIMSVQGRQFPVDIQYLKQPAPNYLRSCVNTVQSINRTEDFGDVLVFLPGSEDIDDAISMLEEEYTGGSMYCLPLYSSLPRDLQMRVFDPTPPGMRKVVFATNIAEASVTIEGIRFVVDSGFVKLNYFDVRSGVNSLLTCPAPKSSATQRAGRAGRTQEGKCFRLMTEKAFEATVPEHAPAEMQRTDISWAVLQLKALGIHDVLHFDFLSPPPVDLMIFALELLYSLGAIDDRSELTPVGEKMAEMPVEPRLSKCLLSSFQFGCTEEMLSVAAMCSVDYPFVNVRARAGQDAKLKLQEDIEEFAVRNSDHLTLLNIYKSFQAADYQASWCDSFSLQFRVLSRAKEVRKNLATMLKNFAPRGAVVASCGEDEDAVKRCLVSGYFSQVAKLGNDGMYHTLRGSVAVSPHYTSVLAKFGAPPEWVLFNEVSLSRTTTIREVTKINPYWLLELAAHYYSLKPNMF